MWDWLSDTGFQRVLIVEDGRERYRIVRVEPKQTRGGFGHAWAELIIGPTGSRTSIVTAPPLEVLTQ